MSSDQDRSRMRGPFQRSSQKQVQSLQNGAVTKNELDRLRKERDAPVSRLVPSIAGTASAQHIRRTENERRETRIKQIQDKLRTAQENVISDFTKANYRGIAKHSFNKSRGRER